MISGGTILNDRNVVKTNIKNAKKALNGLNGSWEGESQKALSSNFDFFYSQVNIVLNDMKSFKTAVDLYEDYLVAKENRDKAKNNMNNATTEADRSAYQKDYDDFDTEMKTLKKQINDALNSITGVKDGGSKKSSQLNIFEQGGLFGNQAIVDIAEKEVGTVKHGGHEKYADYCGIGHDKAWCAAFVSWVCNEAGYSNSINSFTWVDYSVIEKQKENGCDVHYGPLSSNYGSPENKNYVPKAGDIVYYDFENNNQLNHVGIVQSADNNSIHTIEGNTSGEEEMAGNGSCVSHKTRSYDSVYAFVTPKK